LFATPSSCFLLSPLQVGTNSFMFLFHLDVIPPCAILSPRGPPPFGVPSGSDKSLAVPSDSIKLFSFSTQRGKTLCPGTSPSPAPICIVWTTPFVPGGLDAFAYPFFFFPLPFYFFVRVCFQPLKSTFFFIGSGTASFFLLCEPVSFWAF